LKFFKGIYLIPELQILWIVYLMLFSQYILAQYTNVINSNRPGFSESPYSVGSGVYQLETSVFYRETKIHPTFSRPQSKGVNFLFRTSFFNEKLELNLNFVEQKKQISFQNIFDSSYFKTGFSKLSIGAKYLVYEQKHTDKSKEIRSWVARNSFDYKRLIPSIAVYVGVNTGIYKASSFYPKAGILLQNDLSYNFNIITNIYYDLIGTELPEFSYIITATYSFSERWSTFIENQTMLDKYQFQSSIGTGFAFLYNKNIQLNSSLRLLANANYSGYYTSIGASYRFDRHVDKATNLDKNKNQLKDKKSFSRRVKVFFGKLFNNVTNVFTKKGKRKSKLKTQTVESIKKNTAINQNKINNTSLQGRPLRVKPKRTRVKPTKIKPTKDKTKKGFMGIFKGKSTDKDEPEKDSEKGPKELEREIKKLEREIKKDDAKNDKKKKKEKKKLEKEKKKKKAKNKKKENDDDDDGDDNDDGN